MKGSTASLPRNLLVVLFLGSPLPAFAQVVPTTPRQFDRHPGGGSSSHAHATVAPRSAAMVTKHTTFLTLSELRSWTSKDGKTLQGKLIAWEESVAEGPVPPPPTAVPLTSKPTVIRENQVRLLVGTKAFVVPLARLDENANLFIQQLQNRLAPPKP